MDHRCLPRSFESDLPSPSSAATCSLFASSSCPSHCIDIISSPPSTCQVMEFDCVPSSFPDVGEFDDLFVDSLAADWTSDRLLAASQDVEHQNACFLSETMQAHTPLYSDQGVELDIDRANVHSSAVAIDFDMISPSGNGSDSSTTPDRVTDDHQLPINASPLEISRTCNAGATSSSARGECVDPNIDQQSGGIRLVVESKVLILEDGYIWRKYGEKNIKNRLYRRSYYRCAQIDCPVQKQIEKCSENPDYVLTTYFGRHNHNPP